MRFLNKFHKQTNLSTQIIIVVGIILALNFLSYQIFKRFDLTQNKIYSISKTSKETMKNLDDLVNIKVYFSEQLPVQYIIVREEVANILEEYENYANNKIKVEFIDPKDNEELQRELIMLGIPQLQFNILQDDKYEVINGYLGIVVQYGDKKQGIPVVNDVKNLEYQLTSTIKKVTSEKTPSIAFAIGHKEKSTDEDLTLAEKKLSEIYDVRTIDLASGNAIDETIDTLIIIGPEREFSQRQLYVIDQFLMSGGSALFLIDGATVDEMLTANKNNVGLNEILQSYGVRIKQNLVLDASSEMASFNQGFVTFTTNYPFFVKVTKNGFDQENAAVAKLQSLVLPWTSEVKVDESKIAGAEVHILAKSTPQAWLMQDSFTLQPQGDFGFYEDPEIYNLTVAVFGKLNSAFDRYVAKESDESSQIILSEDKKEHISSTEQARIVVVGDSDFATDGFIRRYADNMLFFQNIVDAVSLDSDLIKIRSKDVSARPLKEISKGTKKTIKYLNIFGVTVVVLAFGLVRYFMRKKSRFA